jgi:hypothetical protein
VFELDAVTPESLATFLPRWYGPPDRPASTRALPAALPPPLEQWYRLADRWSLPLSRDHVFVPPTELDFEADPVEFWHAEDGSEAYAYALGERDPMVFERSGDDWLSTGLPLSRFLVYVAVFEAVYAPVHGLVHLAVEPDDLAAVLGRLMPLEDPLWRWPDPARGFYADEDLLAHAGAGRLVVAGRHRDALGRFDGYALDWDWDSRKL